MAVKKTANSVLSDAACPSLHTKLKALLTNQIRLFRQERKSFNENITAKKILLNYDVLATHWTIVIDYYKQDGQNVRMTKIMSTYNKNNDKQVHQGRTKGWCTLRR